MPWLDRQRTVREGFEIVDSDVPIDPGVRLTVDAKLFGIGNAATQNASSASINSRNVGILITLIVLFVYWLGSLVNIRAAIRPIHPTPKRAA